MAVFGHGEVSADVFNNAVKNLKSQMMVLNNHLDGKYFLVGDSITAADVVLA